MDPTPLIALLLLCRYETIKAADAVAALKASLKPTATCKRDGTWANIDARNLVPGDMVLLGAGSAIPADCLINDGRLEVDQSALTGESLPVTMYKGDSCKMGSTAVRGEVEATVEVRRSHQDSQFSSPESIHSLFILSCCFCAHHLPCSACLALVRVREGGCPIEGCIMNSLLSPASLCSMAYVYIYIYAEHRQEHLLR